MKHRQDIDGLRAIAVLAVVLFHFGVTGMSGGYAGVDIFFVISGFLITSILMKDAETQSISFLGFYEKRIRRLFPALFATVLASFIAAYFIFMPDEFREFGRSAIAAIVYLSNVFFWLSSDYFQGSSELSPLLHTWSLAVEEQFYLIFPVIVWASYKLGKRAFYWSVASLFTCSFVASIWYISISASTVFYLSPFRFWELLAGSIVAIAFKENLVPNAKIASWLGVLGLILLVAPIFVLNKESLFPGWAAVPSCLGTALLIWANDQNKWIGKLLKLRFMQFTGKISYSMYLWHWPIVVFYGYWIIRDLVWWDTLLLVIVTYAISHLSCKYLEAPFRLHRGDILRPLKVYSTSIAFSFVIFVLGVLVWKADGYKARFPHFVEQLNLKDAHKESGFAGCFIKEDQFYNDNWSYDSCVMTMPGATETILLWGDSHAFHLIGGLKTIQQELNVNIALYASAGCSPLFDTDIPRNPQCRANNEFVKELIDTHNINGLVLAGNWAWAFKVEDPDIDLSSVRSTFTALTEADKKVFVVNQVPIYPVKNPAFLGMRLSTSSKAPQDYLLAPEYGVKASEQIKSLLPDENVFSPQDLLCEKGKCLIYRNKEIMVRDRAHLSSAASIYIVQSMAPKLKNALGLGLK
ncbi:acyltransferase 3 [Paraglaciecola sp. T6c]|uniref:acyltransferase family protein n=1 Tax=Pseudoalteromonas atlantica (strain T6c / ATCC BAA-1087) TaxID=3042615 RepID=UPI00005C5102|nr:acyltransferase family protein [Paraglaciecola sp. T6c]ABG39610.1 acyltransferase 3 [Paraglaciecola sp. T6c]